MKRASSIGAAVFSLAGAAVFSLACGVEPATATPDTYADFLKLSSQLSCEASLRCCGTTCTPTTDAAFYKPSARALDYLAAGLFAYDRQSAIDCLGLMKQRYTSCDAAMNLLPPDTACTNVLSPQGSVGALCETGINSCGSDSACYLSACTIRRDVGESCSTNPPTCLSDQDSCCLACTGYCAATIRSGQACVVSNQQMPCQLGTFCLNTTLKCTAYAGAGQSCNDSTLPCNPKSGLVCVPPNLTCGQPQADGATCTNNTHCQSGYCLLPNFPLPTQGTCKPQPAPLTVREVLCQPS